MQHLRITGNSNVAIQTWSTYTSDSMIDITTIPTANLGFSTRASSQTVSTSDYSIERQPEIASKFQRQVRDFRPWRAQIKCRQVICDNEWLITGNGIEATKTGNTFISETIWQDDNSNGKSGVFDHAWREETDPGRLRKRPPTRNSNLDVLGVNLAIFVDCSRSLSQTFG